MIGSLECLFVYEETLTLLASKTSHRAFRNPLTRLHQSLKWGVPSHVNQVLYPITGRYTLYMHYVIIPDPQKQLHKALSWPIERTAASTY